jgi:hypothetical protein
MPELPGKDHLNQKRWLHLAALSSPFHKHTRHIEWRFEKKNCINMEINHVFFACLNNSV